MKYFGTDGIRGIPNKKLTIELVTRLGMALKTLNIDDVIIACDTRVSKDMLAFGLASGALSRGLTVHFAGVMPTPALIYNSHLKKCIGIMITASHNPYTDNGIKVLNKGIKLTEDEELMIESLIDNPKDYDGEIGKLIFDNEAKDRYLKFINSKNIKSSLKVCIDCANGATSTTAPLIFKDVTDKLVICANEPDGYNINNGVGSTHLDYLKQHVLDNKCDIGFAFDGDGDRVLCVNKDGKIIDGDMLIFILAKYLKIGFAFDGDGDRVLCVNKDGKIIDGDMLIFILAKYLKLNNKLNQNKVVLTIMSNLGLIDNLRKSGIEVVETNVGDKYVVRELLGNNLSVGGENSGHIIMPQELHTGDGVLVALMILKVLEETNTTIDDWLKDVKMYSDSLVNIRVEDRNRVMNNDKLFNRIEEIRKELNNDCKIIVRASGTEDLIRVTVMAKTDELVKKYSLALLLMVMVIEYFV